jgi:glycogen debranching enzyme
MAAYNANSANSSTLLRIFPDLSFTYHGRSLLATDRAGAVTSGMEGLYEHDLRLLSRLRLLVNGTPPRLDAFSPVDASSSLAYYVCAPKEDSGEKDGGGGDGEERDRQVAIRVGCFVGRGLHEDIEIAHHGPGEARVDLAWELAADFADLVAVRSGKREQSAPIDVRWKTEPDGSGVLRFTYQNPELHRGVLVHLKPSPVNSAADEIPRAALHWDGQRLTCTLTLGRQERRSFCLIVTPVVDGTSYSPIFGCNAFGTLPTARDVAAASWRAEATRLETPNSVVQQAWDRAVADLATLALGMGKTGAELIVPAAGIPLYQALFGRDALTAAGQSLLFSPVAATGTLRLLARHLGTKDDPSYDEQPGRVPQQIRDDPLALLGKVPYLHYYGDYAAPCAYLVLVGAHHLVVGDKDLTRTFLEPARRVLDWLERRADLDGDGFLEYCSHAVGGQKHQGWKDSDGAVVGTDGQQVEPPIASCEIQGYWYAAKVLMAEVFFSLGDRSRALDLVRSAADLKRRFAERYWMPEERYIAFALDSEKRQVKSVVSNAAHCLATGILEGEHAAAVVRRLMAPDMFSGWGIRTLSSDHVSFNPFSYHLGSVWPVENATAAIGMKRYGFGAEAATIAKGMFDTAALFEHARLPETFGGLPRDGHHPHPGIYPDACAPQAWSASAIAWLIQAMLGLWTYAPLRTIIIDPELPEWLPELTLRDLRVADASISLQFQRDASGHTDYHVIEHEGRLHVLRQPSPQALNVGPGARLHDLVESLLPGH